MLGAELAEFHGCNEAAFRVGTRMMLMLRRHLLCCSVLLAVMIPPAQSAFAQQEPSLTCVISVNAETGSVGHLHDFQDRGVLIGGSKGLFLARGSNGAVTVSDIHSEDADVVHGLHDSPGGGVLVAAHDGLFLAREANGTVVAVLAAKLEETGPVFDMRDSPHGGVLIGAFKGLFLAREVNGVLTVEPAGHADTGSVSELNDYPGGGVLIRAEKGLFLAREANGTLTVEPAGHADTGVVYGLHKFQGGKVLIGAERGLFLARESNGVLTVEPVWDAGKVRHLHEFPSGQVLIGSDQGLFLARQANDSITVETAAKLEATGAIHDLHAFSGGGVLVAAGEGLFLAREANGALSIEPAGPPSTRPPPHGPQNPVYRLHEIPGRGILVAAGEGLFLAPQANGTVTVEPAANVEATGAIHDLHAFPGGGVLVAAGEGLFLAREVNNTVTLAPAAMRASMHASTINSLRQVPGGGVLISADNRLLVGVPTSLSDAVVHIQNKKNLDEGPIDRDVTIDFLMVHDCADIADGLNLKVLVTAPNAEPISSVRQFVSFAQSRAAEITLPNLRIDKAGQWSFQLIAWVNNSMRLVGGPQTLTFVSGPWWERWWKIIAKAFVVALALLNVALLALARRSTLAWRMATDDGWGTWVLRFATLVMSYVPQAQLWIIDLYYQRIRKRIGAPRPFLPLPLSTKDDSPQTSTEVLAPPWSGRRFWVQGGSGMGKTALFINITQAHFREHDNAFAAYSKWGCILVAFAARDFASSGDDKDDPAWVVEAVRASLASEGLKFANSALLSRFLESGTLGVAIDGLNEVDRTRAVAAFTRTYKDAPVLVTSQQPGGDRFTTWRLPPDIREFASDLLRLYLTATDAEVVMKRIATSGLKDAIRSGYDVRLIIDLVRSDPHNAELPADRMGLYAAVIKAGWLDVPEELRQEQLSLTEAAAWRMVSERKPNEDMRRLKPDVDLPTTLLVALADAPENDKRPVRLIRRVGAGAFEFVHDQMHAYLAARWFAQDGFSLSELEKMVAGSTIWIQNADARRTLWGFAASLLDDKRLTGLWIRVEDKEDWDILRRALKAEAERRRLLPPDASSTRTRT
jgi:hypothetical protein